MVCKGEIHGCLCPGQKKMLEKAVLVGSWQERHVGRDIKLVAGPDKINTFSWHSLTGDGAVLSLFLAILGLRWDISH